jgi:hypothetical protein
MNPTDSKRLFSPGGCLTATTIRNYLNGSLRLSARLQVDEHLKTCPMCAEAMEGYKSHARRSYIHSDLEILTKKVRHTYSRPSYPLEGKLPLLIFFTVVASLVLMLTVYYILRQSLPGTSGAAGVKADTVQQHVAADTAAPSKQAF